jgi:hypothetical protein
MPLAAPLARARALAWALALACAGAAGDDVVLVPFPPSPAPLLTSLVNVTTSDGSNFTAYVGVVTDGSKLSFELPSGACAHPQPVSQSAAELGCQLAMNAGASRLGGRCGGGGGGECAHS